MKINAGSGRPRKTITIVPPKNNDMCLRETTEKQGIELANMFYSNVAGGVVDSFFKEYRRLKARSGDRRVPSPPPKINDPIERARQ